MCAARRPRGRRGRARRSAVRGRATASRHSRGCLKGRVRRRAIASARAAPLCLWCMPIDSAALQRSPRRGRTRCGRRAVLSFQEPRARRARGGRSRTSRSIRGTHRSTSRASSFARSTAWRSARWHRHGRTPSDFRRKGASHRRRDRRRSRRPFRPVRRWSRCTPRRPSGRCGSSLPPAIPRRRAARRPRVRLRDWRRSQLRFESDRS